MIGPTGCGKTEISRRLARLAGAPFLKVEATKFTEVGYVGPRRGADRARPRRGRHRPRQGREAPHRSQAKAHLAAEERVLDALVGATSSPATRDVVPQKTARQRTRRQGDRGRNAGERPRPADVRHPRHARRVGRRDQPGRHVRQGLRRAREDAPHHGARGLRAAGQRGIRQAPRPGRAHPGGDPAG